MIRNASISALTVLACIFQNSTSAEGQTVMQATVLPPAFVTTPIGDVPAYGVSLAWSGGYTSSQYASFTLVIGYQSSDGSQSLILDQSTDGQTTQGPSTISGIVLGSDPSLAFDPLVPPAFANYATSYGGGIDVAFKSASDDSLTLCQISIPEGVETPDVKGCYNFPQVHMMGVPYVSDDAGQTPSSYPASATPFGPGGGAFIDVAYETSANDANGAGHLGILQLGIAQGGNMFSTPNTTFLQNVVFPILVGGSPSIVGGASPAVQNDGVSPAGGVDNIMAVYPGVGPSTALNVVGIDYDLSDYTTPVVLSSSAVALPPVALTDYQRSAGSGGAASQFTTLSVILGSQQTFFPYGSPIYEATITASAINQNSNPIQYSFTEPSSQTIPGNSFGPAGLAEWYDKNGACHISMGVKNQIGMYLATIACF